MNMQEMMKQAQKMQQAMLSAKKRIDETNFEGESELVKITINGKKHIKEVKIKSEEEIKIDDFEILEDMIMIAYNQAAEKVEKEIDSKLGSTAGGLGELF